MELYHASRNEMKIGERLVSSTASEYYPEASNAIDLKRPNGKPARANALYCSDDPEFAVFFLMKQKVSVEDIKLYKVQALNFHKAPFAITHAVQRRIEKHENIESLVSEYWNPILKWSYYEFLTLEFTIQEILNTPEVNETIISVRYGNDSEQAQKIS